MIFYHLFQCFEDVYLEEKPIMKEVLYYLNIVFAVLFGIEMLMKWIALGFAKYFSNFWTILDFCIVVVCILPLIAFELNLDRSKPVHEL